MQSSQFLQNAIKPSIFEFTNQYLDADDEFKYSSGGIEELILQVTSAETNDI